MNDSDYYKIEKAIEYIKSNFKSQPNLDEIASHVGLSKFHFQRLFKEWAGISPKRFLQFLTIEYTKDLLSKSSNIFHATYDSDLSSSSRLYELFGNIEAITPKEYLSKGKGMIINYGFHETRFGLAFVGITDKGLCALYFGNSDERPFMLKRLITDWPNATIIFNPALTEKVSEQIFTRENNDSKKPRLNLLLKGTNFQVQVWKALLAIPDASIVTYKDIADKVGHQKASRAVGTAVGNNPISFLIPCHRVINKSGIIGNYRWGSNRKSAILAWEAAKNSTESL